MGDCSALGTLTSLLAAAVVNRRLSLERKQPLTTETQIAAVKASVPLSVSGAEEIQELRN